MAQQSSRGLPLSGKPLVFVFMAATVVAVVIFLCGVMVGRGMQARLLAGGEVPADPTRLAPRRPAGVRLPGVVAPATGESLTYAARLERPGAVPETLHEPLTPAPASAAPRSAPVPGRGEPPGSGLAVTVAGYPDLAAAEAVATWLEAKGYPTYISTEAPAGQPRYIVRVGKYRNRREAEEVRARLARDEQFRPVITP